MRSMLSPASPFTLSMMRTSPTDTFSCRPPARTIAYTLSSLSYGRTGWDATLGNRPVNTSSVGAPMDQTTWSAPCSANSPTGVPARLPPGRHPAGATTPGHACDDHAAPAAAAAAAPPRSRCRASAASLRRRAPRSAAGAASAAAPTASCCAGASARTPAAPPRRLGSAARAPAAGSASGVHARPAAAPRRRRRPRLASTSRLDRRGSARVGGPTSPVGSTGVVARDGLAGQQGRLRGAAAAICGRRRAARRGRRRLGLGRGALRGRRCRRRLREPRPPSARGAVVAGGCRRRRPRLPLPRAVAARPPLPAFWSTGSAWTMTPRPSQCSHVLGEDLDQAGADPLAGHLDQAERGDLGDLVLGAVAAQALEQAAHDQVAVALEHHVDEVDDDDAADVAQPELADDLLGRLEVVLGDRLLEVAPGADELAGVDVDDGHRLGAVDDQRAARGQPDLAVHAPWRSARRPGSAAKRSCSPVHLRRRGRRGRGRRRST